jgi:DNA transposition AAA+ family ATPase
MRSKTVPVKNIARLSSAAKALTSRAPGAPGLGLVDGLAGVGKSSAIAWLTNRPEYPSVFLRAMAVSTPASMLTQLCAELRVQPGGSNAGMVTRISEKLAESGRSIFVDEADYIVDNKRLINTFRDLHDMTEAPVILIGELGIEARLQHMHRFTSRIAEHVTFEALDLQDTAVVARELCEVTVAEDLVAQVHEATRGNIRMIVVALGRIEQTARSLGLTRITKAEWSQKQRALFTGEAHPVGKAA